ncbi:MAG: Mrp/NBP35 family ATP-binding protein [Desulfurococcales archaeon]|nr:Mrp/NBP35 family ATP-binding protein [Desulfurococcales archaeon]
MSAKRISTREYKQVAERMKKIQEEQKLIVQRMRKIKYKIAILSNKGGVGKSFVTVSLAGALAVSGRKVGILDGDIHGPTIHKMLGLPTGFGMLARPDGTIFPVEVPPGIKLASLGLLLPEDETPIIWRGSLKTTALRELLAYTDWGELDYLLIDLPPGTGDEQLTIAQLIPDLTGFILVTIPSDVSKVIVKKAIAFANRLNKRIIGIIENMAYFKCPDGSIQYIFGKGAAEDLAKEYGIPFLGQIPIDPRIREANDRGKLFFLEYPESEAAKAFLKAAEKIIEIVEGKKEGSDEAEASG